MINRKGALVIISMEVIIVSIISFFIYKKNHSFSINPILKNYISLQANPNLKFYYEPKPNQQIIERPSWSNKSVIHYINNNSLSELTNYPTKKDPNYRQRLVKL